jgi:TolB-like protein/class 3 adenylate cyclase/Tfp pilus assembly protein PilF
MNPAPSQSSDVKFEIGHVLFIDIVGYSKLLITEQSNQVQTLREIVRGTEQVRRAEADGKLLRLPTGDGGALVFRNSLEEPVLCALEIGQALKSHPELRVRMGIHSGPVNEVTDLNEQSNVAGAGINLAQRVMDCGDAGHILLSKRVADDLEQYPQWRSRLHELGECEVKHGARVSIVNLYTDEVGNAAVPARFANTKKASRASGKRLTTSQMVLASLAALICLGIPALIFTPAILKSRRTTAKIEAGRPGGASLLVPEKSVAVLPFENLSSDKENAYFAEGIQDEILTRLSKIADLKVISRTSTQHYKSAPENLPEIAKQLGVANIVEGSVQKSGDAVRVNVQLIKSANDSHLWADTFDRKLTDIFSVESEVAKAIAEQLRAKLTGQEEQVIAAKPTDNPEAYDAYLRGLAYTLKPINTPANALSAQRYLREAVRLDPKFALGWALLSSVDSLGYISQGLPQTAAVREEARQTAETALTLQPNLGEAILAKGSYHYACLKDYDTGVHYFEQARRFLPNSSRIPESLAYVARRQGQWDRSESYFDEAEHLDPRNVNVITQRALFYNALRRFPEALRKLDQVLDIVPDDVDTLAQKAGIAQAQGDLPRAAVILAPLHPNADDIQALEIQVYQAILGRQPATIIPRLKEILAKPDPALDYINSELRFSLGWAQEVAGDHAAAQETWRQARSELESFLKDQPDNFRLIEDLALTDMALGDKTAGLSLAERAMAANPIKKDALVGPRSLEILARVAAQTGEPDRAIATLQKLLSTPGGGRLRMPLPVTPALLRLDPMFDPLRNDPRFQKLASGAPE